MTATILTVNYRLTIPTSLFRANAKAPARAIAQVPGLVWKIWGLDDATGEGTSLYLFRDTESAAAFAEGPVIDELRKGPTSELSVRTAPVELELSRLTYATPALEAVL
jgi:Putative mono-oxygenase ydhR